MILPLAVFLLCAINLDLATGNPTRKSTRIQCDLAVYINQRPEALVYLAKPKTRVESNPRDCKMTMHVELKEFVRKWNKRNLDEIDRGYLPPLLHFVINSNGRKITPSFSELPIDNSTHHNHATRIYDSSLLPSSTEQKKELQVQVGNTVRALVYFSVSPEEEASKQSFMRIEMKQFLREWYKMDPKNIDWSRLPPLLIFWVYDDKPLILPLAKDNSIYKPVYINILQPVRGVGLSALVLDSFNLKELATLGKGK